MVLVLADIQPIPQLNIKGDLLRPPKGLAAISQQLLSMSVRNMDSSISYTCILLQYLIFQEPMS